MEKVRAVTVLAREPLSACTRVVSLLHSTFPHYTWSGFYLRRNVHLHLLFYRGSVLTSPDAREPMESLPGLAARSRRTQLVPDVSFDPRYERIEIPIKSEVLVPLRWRNRGVAVLDICSGQARAFDRLDLDLLEAVAACMAPLAAALAGEPSAQTFRALGAG